jgi:hypothetical protein
MPVAIPFLLPINSAPMKSATHWTDTGEGNFIKNIFANLHINRKVHDASFCDLHMKFLSLLWLLPTKCSFRSLFNFSLKKYFN